MPDSGSANATVALYRTASDDHFYTALSAGCDLILGAHSSAPNPITAPGTAHMTGISLGTASIDGSSYTVLQWPQPEAGARLRVQVASPIGNTWSADLFRAYDSHDTRLSYSAGQCTVMGSLPGSWIYEFILEYQANGAHQAYEALSTIRVNGPAGGATAPSSRTPRPPLPAAMLRAVMAR